MKAEIQLKNTTYSVDFGNGTDISIPLVPGKMTPNCFYAPFFDAKPFTSGDFTGSVKKGAPVNFFNVFINPHGNGTHTECVGHIIEEPVTINKSCLLYTSDAADERSSVDLGGRRIIKKKNKEQERGARHIKKQHRSKDHTYKYEEYTPTK